MYQIQMSRAAVQVKQNWTTVNNFQLIPTHSRHIESKVMPLGIERQRQQNKFNDTANK